MPSTHLPPMPEGFNTVNAFIITEHASDLLTFIGRVFGGQEVEEAHTVDTDGLLIHSEVRIGDSIVMIADRKPGWPQSPSFLRVYVDDAEATLAAAQEQGGEIVTRPTEFFGDLLSRFIDPWGNMWWVYQHLGEVSWDEDPAEDVSAEEWTGEAADPGLEYIYSTLLAAMESLARRQRE